MSLTPLPPIPSPLPQESAPLGYIICLTSHKINGPSPGELKFRENTAEAPGPTHGPWVPKSSLYHYHYHY